MNGVGRSAELMKMVSRVMLIQTVGLLIVAAAFILPLHAHPPFKIKSGHPGLKLRIDNEEVHHSPTMRHLTWWRWGRSKDEETTTPTKDVTTTEISPISTTTTTKKPSRWRTWFSKAKDKLKKAAKKVKTELVEAKDSYNSGMSFVGSAAKDGFFEAGRAITLGAKKVGNATLTAGRAIKKGAKKLGSAVKRGFQKIRLKFSGSGEKFKILGNRIKDKVEAGDERAITLLKKLGIHLSFSDNVISGSYVENKNISVTEVLRESGMLSNKSASYHTAVETPEMVKPLETNENTTGITSEGDEEFHSAEEYDEFHSAEEYDKFHPAEEYLTSESDVEIDGDYETTTEIWSTDDVFLSTFSREDNTYKTTESTTLEPRPTTFTAEETFVPLHHETAALYPGGVTSFASSTATQPFTTSSVAPIENEHTLATADPGTTTTTANSRLVPLLTDATSADKPETLPTTTPHTTSFTSTSSFISSTKANIPSAIPTAATTTVHPPTSTTITSTILPSTTSTIPPTTSKYPATFPPTTPQNTYTTVSPTTSTTMIPSTTSPTTSTTLPATTSTSIPTTTSPMLLTKISTSIPTTSTPPTTTLTTTISTTSTTTVPTTSTTIIPTTSTTTIPTTSTTTIPTTTSTTTIPTTSTTTFPTTTSTTIPTTSTTKIPTTTSTTTIPTTSTTTIPTTTSTTTIPTTSTTTTSTTTIPTTSTIPTSTNIADDGSFPSRNEDAETLMDEGPYEPPPFPDVFSDIEVHDRLREFYDNGDFSHAEIAEIFNFDPDNYEYYDYENYAYNP